MADESRDEGGERNLPATQRRLEQAREQGQVARSRELPAFLLVALGAGALYAAGPALVDRFGALVRGGLAITPADALDPARMLPRLGAAALDALLLSAPFFGAAVALALLAPLALGGWTLSAKAVQPDLARLDPLRGIGRMFSAQGAAELAKALAKAGVLLAAAVWLIWVQRGEFAALVAQPPGIAFAAALRLVGLDALVFAAALGLVAAADVPFVLWRHHQDLRMTQEEVRRENREMEGDPRLKSRIRSLQRETARRRMMAEVPKADVVVTNPQHYAVALAYREGRMGAPRVLAKGADLVAARIRDIARASGVPLLEAPPLARALYRHAELGAEVPKALYTAVAQVLAWVYRLRAAQAAGAAAPAGPQELDVPASLDPGVLRA